MEQQPLRLLSHSEKVALLKESGLNYKVNGGLKHQIFQIHNRLVFARALGDLASEFDLKHFKVVREKIEGIKTEEFNFFEFKLEGEEKQPLFEIRTLWKQLQKFENSKGFITLCPVGKTKVLQSLSQIEKLLLDLRPKSKQKSKEEILFDVHCSKLLGFSRDDVEDLKVQELMVKAKV
jgi:hypothetical protein